MQTSSLTVIMAISLSFLFVRSGIRQPLAVCRIIAVVPGVVKTRLGHMLVTSRIVRARDYVRAIESHSHSEGEAILGSWWRGDTVM